MMKKKLLSVSLMAAALTMLTSIPAFAEGWVNDGIGWSYQMEDGNYVYATWYTVPDDGTYFFTPDGYMMTNTVVEGFKIGEDGRRIEKSVEQLAEEAAKLELELANPKPGTQHELATIARTLAGSSDFATTSLRLSFQNEMEIIMDRIYVAARRELIAQEVTANLGQNATDTNIELTYRFTGQDRGYALTSTIWHYTNKNAYDYHSNAYELVYNRCILTDIEVPAFDEAFLQLLQAAVGETVGALLYEDSFNDIYEGAINGENVEFQKYGATEAGNYYALICSNGAFTLKITCPADLTEEQYEQLMMFQVGTDEIVAIASASNAAMAEAAALEAELAGEAEEESAVTVEVGETAVEATEEDFMDEFEDDEDDDESASSAAGPGEIVVTAEVEVTEESDTSATESEVAETEATTEA